MAWQHCRAEQSRVPAAAVTKTEHRSPKCGKAPAMGQVIWCGQHMAPKGMLLVHSHFRLASRSAAAWRPDSNAPWVVAGESARVCSPAKKMRLFAMGAAVLQQWRS